MYAVNDKSYTRELQFTEFHPNVGKTLISSLYASSVLTSIDVKPSKNQALCEYCTYVSKLKESG